VVLNLTVIRATLGVRSVGPSKLSRGYCLLSSLLLEAFNVKTAHIAGANVLALNKVLQFVREKFVDNLVVWDWAAI